MDKELKAKWIAALRSGKYQQTTGSLHRPRERYCCLGVLCETAGATFEQADRSDWWPVRNGERIDAGNSDEYLGRSFLVEAGLTNAQQQRLATLNDDGQSFPEIADYIEKNL